MNYLSQTPASSTQPPAPPSQATPPASSSINWRKVLALVVIVALVIQVLLFVVGWLISLIAGLFDHAQLVSAPGPVGPRSETHDFARFCALLIAAVGIARMLIRRSRRQRSQLNEDQP